MSQIDWIIATALIVALTAVFALIGFVAVDSTALEMVVGLYIILGVVGVGIIVFVSVAAMLIGIMKVIQ